MPQKKQRAKRPLLNARQHQLVTNAVVALSQLPKNIYLSIDEDEGTVTFQKVTERGPGFASSTAVYVIKRKSLTQPV